MQIQISNTFGLWNTGSCSFWLLSRIHGCSGEESQWSQGRYIAEFFNRAWYIRFHFEGGEEKLAPRPRGVLSSVFDHKLLQNILKIRISFLPFYFSTTRSPFVYDAQQLTLKSKHAANSFFLPAYFAKFESSVKFPLMLRVVKCSFQAVSGGQWQSGIKQFEH